MRIVMLIETLGDGGAERVTVDLARHLAGRDRDVTIAVPRMPPAWRTDPELESLRRRLAELEGAGVRVVAWHRRGAFAVWEWRPLLGLLLRHRPDVLHAHKLGSALWAVLLGRLCRVPVIIAHDHGASAWPERRRTFAYRHVVGRWSDRVLTVSRPHREQMVGRGVPAHKVAVVVNGLDAVRPTGGDVDARPGPPRGAQVIVAVAMLRPEKGLDVLLRAARLLHDSHPQARLLVAGGGIPTHPDEPGRLLRLAAELGLTDVVTFLGPRGDVRTLLAAADVAVNSSHEEGAPIAVLEYMEAGLPIVATRVGGVPDMLVGGREALLVAPDDPDAMAAALRQVIDDPQCAARLGRAARRRLSDEFSLERTVDAVDALYRDALAARRGRRSSRTTIHA